MATISFGRFIQLRRRRLGIRSAKLLAERSGMSRETVSLLERGGAKASHVRAENIFNLARALEVRPGDLLEWANRGAVPAEAVGSAVAKSLADAARAYPDVLREVLSIMDAGGEVSEEVIARLLVRVHGSPAP